MSKLYMALGAVAVLALMLWGAVQYGKSECRREIADAALDKTTKQAEALVKANKLNVEEAHRAEQVKIIIRKIKDPSGCATTPVPLERAQRMRDEFARFESE